MGFDWVDPKDSEYFYLFRDSSSIASFVDRVCLLKPDVVDDILAIDSCHPTDIVCINQAPFEPPFFFLTLAYFLTFTSLSPSMSLQWMSLGLSMLLLLNFIPIHRFPCRPFVLFVTCFAFTLPQRHSSIIIPLIRPTL